MHADWFKIVFLQLGRNTELAQTVDIMSKENLLQQQTTSFCGLQADKPCGMLVEHEKNL